jgi:hypothetical protein
VPVLVRLRRLREALSPLGGRPTPTRQLTGRLEHAVDAGGTDGDDVGIDHHVG